MKPLKLTKNSLLNKFLAALFIVLNFGISNAFSASYHSEMEGFYGGNMTQDGSYSIQCSDFFLSDPFECPWTGAMVSTYNNFSIVQGYTVNGTVSQTMVDSTSGGEIETRIEFTGDSIITVNGSTYDVTFDFSVLENRNDYGDQMIGSININGSEIPMIGNWAIYDVFSSIYELFD
ncbi:MAG: hypothetical protein HN344_01605 [Gammaproteobacteria bacterium]|jgi:hypothetical protein|nr:hypothetical protein [Gammaproteobacteria bacterium]